MKHGEDKLLIPPRCSLVVDVAVWEGVPIFRARMYREPVVHWARLQEFL